MPDRNLTPWIRIRIRIRNTVINLYFFEILACISDNYLRLTTAHTQILQHFPPSPPQGGDGFDNYIFIGYKYWVRQ